MRTLKQYENRAKTTLEGKSQAETPAARAVELLSSVRTVNQKDASKLLETYGSLNDVICTEDYTDFLNLDGIG